MVLGYTGSTGGYVSVASEVRATGTPALLTSTSRRMQNIWHSYCRGRHSSRISIVAEEVE